MEKIMNYDLSGKTAIVTGASNGVGLSIAKLLCSAGANVVLADNNEVVLNEETLLLKQKGFKVIAFSGDQTKRLTLNNLLAATIDEFETIEILVNGFRQIELSDALNPEKDNCQRLFDLNFMVTFRLSQIVAKKMITQKEKDDSNSQLGRVERRPCKRLSCGRARRSCRRETRTTNPVRQLLHNLYVRFIFWGKLVLRGIRKK